MSTVYTEITLINADDLSVTALGMAKDHKIRQKTVNAMADTGAWTMVIDEATRAELGLRVHETKTGTLADGKETTYSMAGPLEVRWKNRRALCDTIVFPQADDILLGAIPMEIMDLIVHPRKEEVVGAHGDVEVHKVK